MYTCCTLRDADWVLSPQVVRVKSRGVGGEDKPITEMSPLKSEEEPTEMEAEEEGGIESWTSC